MAVACINCICAAHWLSKNSCGQYHRVVVWDRSVTLFDFLCTPSPPNKIFAGFCQTSCLIAVIACWAFMFQCSGVPRDHADTLNSTLPSVVSFLAVAIVSIASSSSSWYGIGRYSHPLLLVHSWGYSPSGTALLRIIFLGCSEFWPQWKKALKSLLGASCVSNMVLFGLICCPTRHWLEETNSPFLVGLDRACVGSRCPSRRLLMEMNSPILVGLDLLGIGSHCLGGENKLTWYLLEITVAVARTGIQWLGLLGNLAIGTGRSCIHGYQLIVT